MSSVNNLVLIYSIYKSVFVQSKIHIYFVTFISYSKIIYKGEKQYMELVIKETGCVKKETCKQKPVFKVKDGILVSCKLNDCKTVTVPDNVKIIEDKCFINADIPK